MIRIRPWHFPSSTLISSCATFGSPAATHLPYLYLRNERVREAGGLAYKRTAHSAAIQETARMSSNLATPTMMPQINLLSFNPRDQRRKFDGKGRTGSRGGPPDRRIRISKAMIKLLRHGAHIQGIAITEDGYVNVADMLGWHKMKRELKVSFEEVVEEVQENDKQRFGLKYVPPEEGEEMRTPEDETSVQNEDANTSSQIQPEGHSDEREATSSTTTTTQLALQSITPSSNPSHYLIRATQGHSLKTIAPSSYLVPIILSSSSPSSTIPSTVVHGTFYAAWDSILRTGGLKPMSRLHVHFATGPSLESVLPGDANTNTDKARAVLSSDEKAVISGMRSDAQLLIYINMRKALEMGIPFWMSENGVVLSEGTLPLSSTATAPPTPTPTSTPTPTGNGSGSGGENSKQEKLRQPQPRNGKRGDKEAQGKEVPTVPASCWDVVVEVKEGLGVIWRDGEVVKEIPAHLRASGWPHRKGGKRTEKSKSGKPRLRVERQDDDAV